MIALASDRPHRLACDDFEHSAVRSASMCGRVWRFRALAISSRSKTSSYPTTCHRLAHRFHALVAMAGAGTISLLRPIWAKASLPRLEPYLGVLRHPRAHRHHLHHGIRSQSDVLARVELTLVGGVAPHFFCHPEYRPCFWPTHVERRMGDDLCYFVLRNAVLACGLKMILERDRFDPDS